MSGIAGIFAREGGRIDPELLRDMTGFMDYRGPDARRTWSSDICGFGHTMLRTTRESLNERQPVSLDGLWITADARLDQRAELKSKIEAVGQKLPADPADCDLLLHAYATWGEKCVEHLRGDFAFAIWDSRRKTLFCARDHFGVKPFYYSDRGGHFVFSNTLSCIRLCPWISDELNEASVGDFLLFGLNCNPATTIWRDVQRLPAAHYLAISADSAKLERYWAAPTDGCTRYARGEDYVDHFRELLREAVAERLSPECTGIFLSGGMDSSSLAAIARQIYSNSGGPASLRAFTVVSNTVKHSDGEFARQVADHLRIPIQFLNFDGLAPFQAADDLAQQLPEPIDDPLATGIFGEFAAVAENCRVVFDGEGSDNLMHFEMLPYARHLWRSHDWNRLCKEGLTYLWVRPFPWRGIRQRLRSAWTPSGPALPEWIEPDFAHRQRLEDRVLEMRQLRIPNPSHPLLPKAHASLELPQWSAMFEMNDPSTTRSPVEVRYPFLDLRVVNYLLSLPPFPWAFQKKILRDSMHGSLPETILGRPKTPLCMDPSMTPMRGSESKWIAGRGWSEQLARFVNYQQLGEAARRLVGNGEEAINRALCLKFWLLSLQPSAKEAFAKVSYV